MKLFPHILSRVAGIPFYEMNKLSFSEMEYVNTLLQIEQVKQSEFIRIQKIFSSIFQKTNDFRFRAILINAQKDFRNERFSFIKKIKKEIPIDIEEDVNVLLQEVQQYQTILLSIIEKKKEFEFLFEKDKKRQLIEIHKHCSNQNFQKAILHSSRSFFHRIQSFHKKEVSNFRKKEMQTARSVVQYLYRVIGKTSPFSYFTSLDILSLERAIFKNSNNTKFNSFIQINNFILAESQEILIQNPSFFKNLKIKLNPSIQLTKEEFIFLKNEKNIESFQRLESSEVLRWLHNKIHTDSILFSELLDNMSDLIDAEPEVLADYFLQIIETGFLEWDWGFCSMQTNWENNFYELISSAEDFEGKKLWLGFVGNLVKYKKQYPSADIETRIVLQNSIKESLEILGFEKVIPELIFFEDVHIPHEYSLSEKEIFPIVKSLETILRSLEPLVENEMKNKIQWLWKNYFKEEDRVPLLKFYEVFYEKDFSDFHFLNKEKKELRAEWKNTLKKKISRAEDGILHFSTSNLEQVEYNSTTTSKSKKQYSALFQFFKEDKITKAVINGLAPGFGKLWGRFLPLFENRITIDLQEWNIDLQEEDTWIENVDASYFNANVHPPLLGLEMKTPYGQNQLSKESQVSIHDLEIVWSKKENAPILVFSPTKKRVTIFDFGFEHPSNRSPLFQLLNGFSFQNATYRILNELINELYSEKKENGIIVFPKIIIDEHLVLQRGSQDVPISFFPKKEKSETAAAYFLKIQNWKNENDLPQHIFIRPLVDESYGERKWNKDFYKPQLIDLDSPFAIVLLQKVLDKHDGKIKIEEMLPSLKSIDGSDYVREEVIQWSNNENTV